MAAVVVIAGVAACAIYLSSGDDGGKEYGDSYLEGYWYQIEYEGYVDDVYIHTDDSNKNTTPFNIEIIECHDNVLYGTFHNKYFSGTYANKTMSFYGSYGEMSAMVSGYVGNDGRLHLTIIQQGDSITGALSAVYSKDPLDRCDIPGSIDVAGAWTVSKARAVDTAGNVYALSGNELTITESKGPVFKGIMEQQIEGKIISLDCWGVVSDRSVNGYRAGYMTYNGENWNVSISPYEFVLQTSMIDDTGNTDSIVAIERSYISDSTEARPSFYSLDNTSWSLYNSYDASYSHIEERYFDFVMKFDNQEDTLLSGSMRFGGTEYEMVGHLTRAGELCVFGDYISSNIYGCGWVNEDSITLCEWYGDYTTVFNFKSADQNSMMTDRNMVGHWSGLCAATLDESNEVTETNNQNIDRSGLYGLDIYASSNGMFYGNFRDTFITGEIIDSRLSFSAVLSDGSTVYFWGTMDGKVMDSMEIYYKSDDTMLVRNSIYSKDGSMYGGIDVSSPDLAKSWKSPSGYSVIYDGEKSTILGENLVMNFNDEYGRFITGTIEEEVAGEVKNLKYLGIMGRSDNPVDGFLLDENGHFYITSR